jgi:hypothetical protein
MRLLGEMRASCEGGQLRWPAQDKGVYGAVIGT